MNFLLTLHIIAISGWFFLTYRTFLFSKEQEQLILELECLQIELKEEIKKVKNYNRTMK